MGNVGNVDPTSACATSNAGAALPPISLVFMNDKSGSMAEDDNVSTLAARWQPVVSGLSTFFGDAASSNSTASLSFFPVATTTVSNQTCQRNKDCNDNQHCIAGKCTTVTTSCTASDYATPVVPMTQLPNATPFTTVLNATAPGGNTPTAPALTGAIAAAKAVKAEGSRRTARAST